MAKRKKMAEETPESPYPELDSLNMLEAIRKMAEVRNRLDELKAQATEVQKEFDHLRSVVVPQRFEENGVENMNVEGVGRVSLRSGLRASIPASAKEEAYKWLKRHRHGDLISQTVHAGSLAAMIKDLYRQGKDVPRELFNIFAYTQATITKK